uniref:Putative secreted protein n=1 Tax=Amblyomma triste TaxID=251400 RepID=A0A023GAT6_AMBTT
MIPIILVTLFVGAFGATVNDANRYIDEVLGRQMPTLVYRNRLDPLPVADYVTSLSSPGVLRAEMRKVNVTGLGQIRRQGDCGRPGTSGPGRVTVGCNVVLDRVAVSATSDLVYFRNPSQRIGVRANFATNHALIEVTSVLGQPPIVNLRLLRPLQPHLVFSNLKSLPVYSVIEKGYSQELSRILQTQLSGPYLANLGTACRAVPFPR